jgi:hypothetical protein
VIDLAPLLVLVALGAFHGLNPAMGWLFAVSRGLQNRSRSAVLASLGPLAAGHALSIALVVAIFGSLQLVVDIQQVRYLCAAALLGLGLFKLLKPFNHPRWVSMRVGGGQLCLWSFLMASAHGAGLMLIPALGSATARAAVASDPHVGAAGVSLGSPGLATTAVLVHSLAMFVVTGVVAVAVYDRFGLAFLRKAWLNVDIAWAIALLLSGLYVLAITVEP